MATLIKDVVCFLANRDGSATVTAEHLKKLECAGDRVLFILPPLFNQSDDGYTLSYTNEYITAQIAVAGDGEEHTIPKLKSVVLDLLYALNIDRFLAWHHTASAQSWTDHLCPTATGYYCDDLKVTDADHSKLAERADFIFTPGLSTYEFLKARYDNVFLLESTIDCSSFEEARYYRKDPVDQAMIPHPRIGHFGDIRSLDLDLVETLATQRHGWQFIFLSEPIEGLGKFQNIHFLGNKPERLLPDYISNWDIGFLPYGPADVRRFLDPPQATQFLAAGKPLICTPMPDVMRRFEKRNLIHVSGTPADFMMKIHTELRTRDRTTWHLAVREFTEEQCIDRSLEKAKDYLKSCYHFEAVSKTTLLSQQA